MIQNKNFKNYNELFDKAISYAVKNEIHKIVLFVKQSKNVIALNKKAREKGIEVIASTFPMNQELFVESNDGEINEISLDIYSESEKTLLDEEGIKLVSATLPLDPIIVPGNSYNPYVNILRTLNLFGEGIDVAVQSALMTTDSGVTSPGERILSLNTKVILDINTCNSRFLYHYEKGLKINQVIK